MTESRHRIEEPERLADPGSSIVAEVDGIELGVFNVEGDYYALPNRCPHVGGPLADGPLTGVTTTDEDGEIVHEKTRKVVECPWHCWRFDVTTGENVDDSRIELPTVDVHEEDGELYVEL